MGAGGKSGGKVQVTDYYMSLHYRICHSAGEVDLLGIYVGEKEAWSGLAETEQDIAINRPDLFGGNKKEGGVAGVVRFLPGGPDQVLPDHLAGRLGLTSATAPGYRGMASLFFTGAGGGGATPEELLYFLASGRSPGNSGFLWSSNNPYLKSIWAKVRRRPQGLNPATAFIDVGDGRKNANPAHVIYECLINTDWGQGGAPSGIDTASYEAAAQTLFDEKFGLFLTWTKQTDIEAFVSEVLDHIQATQFVNPRTGLMTLKLIRGDYDIDDLPILNADNCVVEMDRKGWGETTNEIVVTWTNPENEQEETITAQNNANIAIQGGIISDSRNYYGVRSADKAQELAFRDLASASWPLASFEILVDRTGWDFVPGGCARLQYPEYGLDDVVIRIGKIDYGKIGDPTIKLSALEDIFALANAEYDPAEDSQWTDPAENPDAPEFARIITAPAFFAAAVLSAADTAALEYPEVVPAALISQSNSDTFAYNLYGQTTQPNGSVTTNLIGTRPMLGHGLLPALLPGEAETLLPSFGEVRGGPGPRPGGFVIIGNVTERGQEICLLESFDEDGWVIKRGVLDTVPRNWVAGTVCWFVSPDANIIVGGSTYSASETVHFKVTPSTSRGTLALDTAPILGATLTGRPHLPLRPANVTVAGTAFGTADLSTVWPVSTVSVTWANRNRLTEDTQVMGWSEGDVTPEAGQTVTIKIFSTAGELLDSVSGLTGTSHALDTSSFGTRNAVDVRFYSVRDGLESLQGHTVRIKLRPFGWDYEWGSNWGGGEGDAAGPTPEPPEDDPAPPDEFPDPPPWNGPRPIVLDQEI